MQRAIRPSCCHFPACQFVPVSLPASYLGAMTHTIIIQTHLRQSAAQHTGPAAAQHLHEAAEHAVHAAAAAPHAAVGFFDRVQQFPQIRVPLQLRLVVSPQRAHQRPRSLLQLLLLLLDSLPVGPCDPILGTRWES